MLTLAWFETRNILLILSISVTFVAVNYRNKAKLTRHHWKLSSCGYATAQDQVWDDIDVKFYVSNSKLPQN